MARLISILLFALVALLWLSAAPSHAAPLQCSAGTYGNGTTCTTCPAGSYCPKGSATPTADDAGYYSIAGAGNQIPCPVETTCPAGILLGTISQSLTLDPASPGNAGTLTFTPEAVGQFATLTLQLSLPSGDANERISGFAVSGTTAPFALLGLATTDVIKDGQPLDLGLVFAPTSAGTATMVLTLNLTPDGGVDPAFSLTITGNATTTLPEPMAMALFMVGLVALVQYRLRLLQPSDKIARLNNDLKHDRAPSPMQPRTIML